MSLRPVDPAIARGILASFAIVPVPTVPAVRIRGPVRTRVVNKRRWLEVPEIAALRVGESLLLNGPHFPRLRMRRAQRLAPDSEFRAIRKSVSSWIVERVA